MPRVLIHSNKLKEYSDYLEEELPVIDIHIRISGDAILKASTMFLIK